MDGKTALLFVSLLVAAASPAVAGDEHLHHEAAPVPCAACARPSDHTFDRAGYPQCLSRLAHPSNSKHYIAGFVGGSRQKKGEPRKTNEGTWGWDYKSIFFPNKTFLKWGHCRPHQPSEQGYETDGPLF
ncbi:MAG: hypothetical protein ACRC1K_07355, partial [Planctomycetia bacterium]